MKNQITPEDLQLVVDAQAALASAQATLQFVSAHLAKVYELQQGDGLDLKTGEVKRREAQPIPGGAPIIQNQPTPDGAPIITP